MNNVLTQDKVLALADWLRANREEAKKTIQSKLAQRAAAELGFAVTTPNLVSLARYAQVELHKNKSDRLNMEVELMKVGVELDSMRARMKFAEEQLCLLSRRLDQHAIDHHKAC